MRTEYDIYFQNKPSGKAIVIPQGLYYSISCCCDLDHNQIYELIISGKGMKQNLGVLVPENGKFSLVKKIPIKRFTEGELSFTVIVRDKADMQNYIVVEETLPFPYIEHLEHAVMKRKDGKAGICYLEQ